jgi:LAS superfamily LD-carboxypeptidase LdcB
MTVIALVTMSGSAVGAMMYFGNQSITKKENDASVAIAKVDKQIAQIKAKKEAAKRAAAQTASSDNALSAQLQGEVVTPFGCAISGKHGNPSEITVLVNKKHCFNPINYAPDDLVSFDGFLVSNKIANSLRAMFNAASASGIPLSLTSSYRSYSDQVATYTNWVKVNGSNALADTVSARPGYSEHQSGFAVDLSTAAGCSLECFAGSAQYQWLKTYAANYGFIERYPPGLEGITGYSPEAWHWRFVGSDTAQEMKTKGTKTLEQLWGISGGGY